MSNVEQFREAIRAAGLEPPEVIEADGKLHRFSSNGRRGDSAGWYVLHCDGIPAGSFGDWRDDEEKRLRAHAKKKAAAIWQAAQPAPEDYPYLIANASKRMVRAFTKTRS